jgi:hypothetical protein
MSDLAKEIAALFERKHKKKRKITLKVTKK